MALSIKVLAYSLESMVFEMPAIYFSNCEKLCYINFVSAMTCATWGFTQ